MESPNETLKSKIIQLMDSKKSIATQDFYFAVRGIMGDNNYPSSEIKQALEELKEERSIIVIGAFIVRYKEIRNWGNSFQVEYDLLEDLYYQELYQRLDIEYKIDIENLHNILTQIILDTIADNFQVAIMLLCGDQTKNPQFMALTNNQGKIIGIAANMDNPKVKAKIDSLFGQFE